MRYPIGPWRPKQGYPIGPGGTGSWDVLSGVLGGTWRRHGGVLGEKSGQHGSKLAPSWRPKRRQNPSWAVLEASWEPLGGLM